MIDNVLKTIKNSKILAVSLSVALLAPTLYTGAFYKLSGDPLDKISTIKVGVVNEDKEIDYNDKKVAVGKTLENKLKVNKSVDWQFVDSAKAEDELRDGAYSMVVYIPENFSKNSTTLLNDNPEKMDIQFKTNYSKSKNGETLMKSVASKLTSTVKEEVTKGYAEALFTNLKDIETGLGSAKSGSEQITGGLDTLKEKSSTLSEGVGKLSSGSTELSNGIITYTNGVATLDGGLLTAKDGTGALLVGAEKLNQGLNSLSANNDKLLQGSLTLTAGVEKISGGLLELQTGGTQFAAKGEALVGGVSKLNGGIEQIFQNSSSLSTGNAKLSEGITTTKNGFDELLKGVKSLQATIPTDEQLTEYDNKITKLIEVIKKQQSATSTPSDNSTVQSSNTDNSSLTTSLTNIKTQVANLKMIAINVNTSISQTDVYKKLSVDDQKSLLQSVNSSVVSQLNPILLTIENELTALSTNLPSSSNSTQSNGGVQSSSINVNNVTATNVDTTELEKLHNLVSGYKLIGGALTNKIVPAGDKLSEGMGILNTNANALALGSNKFVTEGLTPFKTGISNLNMSVTALPTALTSLNEGIGKLSTGSSKLVAGSVEFGQGLEKYTTGVSTISGGFGTFEQGLVKLDRGIDKIVTGSNSNKLVTNSSKLTEGSNKIAQGLSTMNSNMPTLVTGVDKLAEGSSKLTTALATGVSKLNMSNIGDKNEDMLANPVSEKVTDITAEHSYGETMLAYFIVIGLYLGALLFNLLLTSIKSNGFRKKIPTLITFSLIQSLITIVSLKILFTINISSFSMYSLSIIAISLAFTLLISSVIALLNNVGKVIAVAILIIQLATGVGLYPRELTPTLLNYLSPFVPTLKMLQQAILGGMSNVVYKNGFLIVLLISLISLILLTYKKSELK